MQKGTAAILVGVILALIVYYIYASSYVPAPLIAQGRDYVEPIGGNVQASLIPILVIDMGNNSDYSAQALLSGRNMMLILHQGDPINRNDHAGDVFDAYQVLNLLTQNNTRFIDLNNAYYYRLELVQFGNGGTRKLFTLASNAGLRAISFQETTLAQGQQATLMIAIFADGSQHQVRIMQIDRQYLLGSTAP